MAFDVYQAVTDRIVEMLDGGTVPWRHPICNAGGGWPKNLESGRPYRGVNTFLLSMTSWIKGYDSAYWMTFRQAQAQGGHVRKGEKSSMVVFWKQLEVADKIKFCSFLWDVFLSRECRPVMVIFPRRSIVVGQLNIFPLCGGLWGRLDVGQLGCLHCERVGVRVPAHL